MAKKQDSRKDGPAAVRRAIARAESILPGRAAAEGARDARWQAIIRIGEFIESQPEPVWRFALRWGKHANADLRSAVATCLVEHLLEHHFDEMLPRLRTEALKSVRFANTVGLCWSFGEAAEPGRAASLRALCSEIRRKHKALATTRRPRA